jgi:hypothetical protein
MMAPCQGKSHCSAKEPLPSSNSLQGKNIIFQSVEDRLELDEKENVRKKLDQDIKEKLVEAEFWTSLTAEEKRVVSEAAIAAVPKEWEGRFWVGILISFLVSILAILTWTLLGNPGKTDILAKFESLLRLFK